jgi:hypothetical protein
MGRHGTTCPRHDVVAIQLSDPRERALPSIGLATRDLETGDWKTVDLSSRQRAVSFTIGGLSSR